MTLFVSIGALLALLTLALLTRPFWRRGRDGSNAPAQGEAALRQQIDQLAALHAAGALNQEQHAQARAVLEKKLIDTVAAAPEGSVAPRAGKALLASLAGFVGVVTIAGYAWLGTPRALEPGAVAAAPTAADQTVTAEQIDSMIQALAARLKERPEDVEGWTMLGRSHAALGRHEQAVPAFKQAMALRPNDAGLITDYADALAMANGLNLEGEPNRLIEQALKVDPNNFKALSLAGTVAFNRQNYAQAIAHWERLTRLGPGTELAQQIQGGIDEARRRMATPAAAATPAALAPSAPAPPATTTAAPTGASISGTVTLAASLTGKAQPEDTLFVYARAAEGSRMPLAILRKQVKDLPLSFTLDDSMAMSPAARLSSVARVVVSARISKRGEATPQTGDLQGLSAPVAPGAAGLKIQISEVVAAP